MNGGSSPAVEHDTSEVFVTASSSPSLKALLVGCAAAVALFATVTTLVAASDPGTGALDARLRGVLDILAATLLVGAGLLRWARWRVTADARSLVAGTALLFFGGVAMPLTFLAEALQGDATSSLLTAATAVTTGLLTMGIAVRALNTPPQDPRLRPLPLLARPVIPATAAFLVLLFLHRWSPDLLSSTLVSPGVLQGALLAVAWFCVGLEATLRSPRLPWAGRAAPLLGAMAVAELSSAVGTAHPGHGYRVAAAALVALVASAAMYGALVDLGRPAPGPTLPADETDPRPDGNSGARGEVASQVIPGRRVGDSTPTVVERRPHRPQSPAPLEHLVIRSQQQPVDVDLEPLLHEVVEQVVPGLEVTLADCDVQVHGRPDDLRTVFANLLVNVRDHARTGAVVKARDLGTHVEVAVADQGPGMSPTQVATLFQRGARGADGRGSGLGLHVAHTLATQQGGDLTLRNHVGGCTFAVSLWGAGGPDTAPLEHERRTRQRWSDPATGSPPREAAPE